MQKYIKKIYQASKESYYKILKKDLKNQKRKFIITVNPETLMLSEEDSELQEMLDDKESSLTPDGIAIIKAAKKLGINIKMRITGIDIASFLLEEANKNSYSLYLFGASEEVINKLELKIKNDYPNIKMLGVTNGYIDKKEEIMEKIIKLEPDIVMLAMGIPLQEKLIYKYYKKAKKGIFIGVGGSFDVLSGTKKRAPKIFIKLNLEWLYRIIKEPKRIKRFYNNNVKFILKIGNKKKPKR